MTNVWNAELGVWVLEPKAKSKKPGKRKQADVETIDLTADDVVDLTTLEDDEPVQTEAMEDCAICLGPPHRAAKLNNCLHTYSSVADPTTC